MDYYRLYLLGGKVTDGQFDTEAAVTFKDAGGKEITTLVSRTLLHKDSQGRERLRVRAMAKKGDGYLVVEVPGDVYGATRGVAVAPDILEPLAPGA